jgi:hypothetical protein
MTYFIGKRDSMAPSSVSLPPASLLLFCSCICTSSCSRSLAALLDDDDDDDDDALTAADAEGRRR